MLIRCSTPCAPLARLIRGFATVNASADDLALALLFVVIVDGAPHCCDAHQADTRRVLLVVLARTI